MAENFPSIHRHAGFVRTENAIPLRMSPRKAHGRTGLRGVACGVRYVLEETRSLNYAAVR